MTVAIAVSNGITITMSMVCCVAYLYKYRWRQLGARPLVASILIITLTIIMYVLQVLYPTEVLHTLVLDVAGLKAGEWWRFVTPLFVQPYGPFQFFFNMMFLVVFLPMTERLYGARVWFLYFVPGVVGQIVNCVWRPGGGGSSTAAFGVMGSVLMYVLWHRKSAPSQYGLFAILGICGAVVMCFTRDGHGPGLLTGAVLATFILWSLPQEHPKDALQASHEKTRLTP